MENFKCPSCKTEMILRNGKYGPFFYCKDHGTISMRAAKKITVLLKRIEDEHTYVGGYNENPLKDLIFRQSIGLGEPMDNLTDLAKFTVDNHYDAQDNEDHWMNIRDY